MVGGSGGEGVGGPGPVRPFLCVREGHWLLRGWLPLQSLPVWSMDRMEGGASVGRGLCWIDPGTERRPGSQCLF